MTETERPLEGRIPFRIRIGVTGHRNLTTSGNLAQLPAQIRKLVPETAATAVRLGVVSALAEGADRLVVDQVFEQASRLGEEARLEVVLPFSRQRYIELQEFSSAAKDEFEAWLARATSVVELGGPWGPKTVEASYEAAGQHVVNACDVLIAIWDGKPSRGRGGTAETLLYAAELGKPCIWIPSDGGAQPADNLAAHSELGFRDEVHRRAAVAKSHSPELPVARQHVLEPLHDAFRELDGFNRSSLPPVPRRTRRLEQELGDVEDRFDWVAGPFVRATLLADRYESRFTWATWLMSVLATGAAACLGASVAQEEPSRVWAWAEVASLLALVAVFLSVHRLGLHRRWLSYRLLAERFRSAYFIAPTGIDFRSSARLDAVFVERRSMDWLFRAFEEVWDSRPNAASPPRAPADDEIEALRRRLADEWIGGQIVYHAAAKRRHERRSFVLTSAILLLFFGAVLFATLHATTEAVEKPSIFLSITLPVAAAAVGVVLTVRQHRALAERYGRMHSDLISIQRSFRSVDAGTIGKITAEAARIIAEENGDWFGAMWFLDVEHPP